MTTSTAVRPVLVGVDGTARGEHALEWALREALVRDVPVQVVTVWSWDGRAMGPTTSLRRGHSSSRPAGRARQGQETLLARVLAHFRGPVPPVVSEIDEGDPASRLIERSGSADLLVLGGHEDDGADVHGYDCITRTCLRYAGCPVVVVPPLPVSQRLRRR